MSAGRPPHVIAPDEVDAWLADSAVRVVTYHNTDRRSADAIMRNGARVERSWIGSYGQGFYTTTVPDTFYGEISVPVAVRLRAALIAHLDDVEVYMDRLTYRLGLGSAQLTPVLARRIRDELIEAGYDGLVIYDAGGDGIDLVVALDDESIRVVEAR